MLKTEKKAGSARSEAKSRGFKVPGGTKVVIRKAGSKQATSRLELKANPRLKKSRSFEVRTKEGLSRLEARIPTDVYAVIERAAALRGLTVTAYVTATMGEDARRTIEQTAIIRLSHADQIAFAKALISPPEPNAKLIAIKRGHAELFGK